jgi:opacity protein-like surface antigen
MTPGLSSAFIPSRAGAALALAGALVAGPAIGQEWSVYAGAAGRVEYNDNYFFVVPGQPVIGSPGATEQKESAITLSLLPFVAASRRTEVSEVTALLAIGANKVWNISPSEDYLSGAFSLNGTLREERSTWSGRASYTRSSSLEQAITAQEVLLVRTYTDAATLEGSYNYQLTDRWTAGATVGGYANWYDSVQGAANQSDDWGYNVIGNLGHIYSDQTRFTYTLGYTYYSSDITRSNVVTTTLGVVHRFSPQLTVSGSVGGFWSDTTARQNLPGQGTPIDAGENRDDSGTLIGGSVLYAFSESTQLDFRASQGLAPSGTGTISESTNASIALLHQFSDRLSGRVAAGYSETTYPVALTGSADDRTITAGAGLSYQLAERWKLDAGYTYTRTRYARDGSEPASNVVFLSLAYNWPGASFTGWVGNPLETQGLPAAGPLSLPERPGTTPGAAGPAPTTLPFDTYTLP